MILPVLLIKSARPPAFLFETFGILLIELLVPFLRHEERLNDLNLGHIGLSNCSRSCKPFEALPCRLFCAIHEDYGAIIVAAILKLTGVVRGIGLLPVQIN